MEFHMHTYGHIIHLPTNFTVLSRGMSTAVNSVSFLHTGVKNEGWFDPWSLLFSFRKKALHLGVHLLDGSVVGMETRNERVTSVKVQTCVSLYMCTYNILCPLLSEL